MSRFKRLITLILAVLFLNTSIPTEVLAETLNGGNKATQADPYAKEKESKKEALILQEIKEKRTSNTKYFLKDDHSYEVAIYPNDIHYYEDGQWKDIDNSFEEVTDIEQDVSGKEVKQQTSGNKGNDFKIKVAKHSDSKKLVKVAKGKYEISWGFNDIGKVKGETTVLENSNIESLSENDKKQLVKNNSSQINFSNVYKNIDLQYNIIGRKLKENFIIKEKTEIPQIQFQIEMKNLTYKINDDNTITFLDEITKEKVFEIEPPIMHDAAGEVSTNIKFTLADDKKGKGNLNSSDGAANAKVVEENNKGEGSSNTTNITNENSTTEGNEEAEAPNKSEETLQKPQKPKEDCVSNKAAEQNVIEQRKDNVSNSDSNTNIDNSGINAEKEISKPVNENISNSNNNTNNSSTNNNNSTKVLDNSKENKETEKKPQGNGKDKDNNKNVLNLTIELDRQWINSSERVFPITVDPTVGTSLDTKKIYDTFILEKNPSANRWNTEFLATGNGSASGINRSLMKFDLPALTSSDMVVEAKLNLALWEPDTNVTQVNAYKINSSWDPLNTTWSNQPAIDSAAEDYAMVTGSAGTWYGWDITRVVKEWYNTGVNNGIMLKNHNESETYNVFVSSDSAPVYTAGRPRISIAYVSNSGLESYWTYHSQSAGRAGTGYVNDYNGNLVHIHDDVTMTGSRNPITVQHVYNSNNLGYNPAKPWMGRGWSLNIYQWLVRENIGGKWYYKYTDGDGTNIFFPDDGKTELKDELNQGYTLTIETGGYWKSIKDKQDNKIRFYGDDLGSVHSFIDKSGNTTTATWKKFNEVWCITALTDAAGRTVTLDYINNGYLTSITDASGLKTQFILSNWDNDLAKVIYPDGKSSEFVYTSNFYLYWAKNIDGYSTCYHYTSNSPYRVKSIYEWKDNGNNTGTYGKQIYLEYGNNTTTFTDLKGRKEIYQFNDNGQTISIKDAEDKADYYKYNENDNKTKLGQSSKLQSTVLNYLENHDAELNAVWYPLSDAATYTTEEKYLGSKSLKINSAAQKSQIYFAQSLKLQRGKTYTLSGYVKTKDIPVKDNSGAALTLGYQDASGQWKYVREFIKGTSDWNRYETTLTVPNDISNDYIWVAAELVETTGTAYFDSLQLEEGQFANRYNLIENSDFTLWDKTTWKPIYWKSNNAIDSTDYVDYSYSNNHPKAMNTLSMKINGNARAGKGIYQDVNIAGKKGDVYVLGGWAKANAAPLVDWRLFQMDLGFVKYDGSIFWKKLSFNDDVWDWQYAASEIVAPEDYKGIQVYISYYQNLGNAYFDGIQLYKEEFGTSYQYDSKGNVISTADLAKQNSKFQYDGNNNLTTSIDPKGSSFTYEYDNGNASVKKHNLTKATSAENVVYSFDYDNFGNAKWSKVGSDALFIKSDASYTPSGNYIKDVVDPRGNKVTFDYDEANGNLRSVTDPEGKVTSYSYNPKTNNLESVKKAVNGTDITNSYDYENDKIKKINHNGFGYEFQYDNFGNNTVVKVKGKDPAGQEATQNLITNTYEERNGNFKEATYGNGHKVSNIYDAMDRVIGKKFGTDLRVKYQYNANNNLALKEDLVNKKNYRYNYDLADRLSTIKEIDPATSKIINETRYNYDLNNNVSEVNEKINNYNYNIAYGYNKDNKPTSVTHKRGTLGQQLSSIYNISYGYDTLGRLENKKIAIGTTNFQTNYKYYEGKESNSTTNLIKTIENGGKAISYEYDSKGNISKILEGDIVIQQYYYNEVNELIREDNKALEKTIAYSYDFGGNILNKKIYSIKTGEITESDIPEETINYTYEDTVWKEKLTSYNGKPITYDNIGNPLTYEGYNFTWEGGRQLKGITGNGKTISYKYNDSGIRTEKTVDGVTTTYHLVGDKVTFESNGTDNVYYTYDAAGKLVSMNLNGNEYFYVRNAQGDIIGLIDKAGTQVVSYTYDSWGKLISIDGTLKDTVGIKNPYRYRGYRYDTETGLYYLQSRYYNPEWGRFINADSEGGAVGELLSHNVFAYCSNNPVNRFDPDGRAWWVIGAIAGAVVGGIAGAAYSYYTTGSVDWRYVAGGAAAGALVGAGLGYAAETVFATITAVAATSSTAITKYDPKFAAQQLVRGGKTTTNALKSMVPKGSVNQFKPSSTISNGYKYVNKINGTKVELKWHAPDLNAAAKFGNMSNSASGWTAQIKVGNRLLGQDLNFYKNPSNITHIPLFPGGE